MAQFYGDYNRQPLALPEQLITDNSKKPSEFNDVSPVVDHHNVFNSHETLYIDLYNSFKPMNWIAINVQRVLTAIV